MAPPLSESVAEATVATLLEHGGAREPQAILMAVESRDRHVLGSSDLGSLVLDREAAHNRLTEAARDMHRLDADAFTDLVLDLDLSPWPDLEAWRVKLGVTLQRRGDYSKAHELPDIDSGVFDPVWGLAICPARDAAQVEDLFLSAFMSGVADAENDPLPTPRSARRTVKRLRRDCEFVANRHAGFLERVLARAESGAKARRSRVRRLLSSVLGWGVIVSGSASLIVFGYRAMVFGWETL